MLAMPLRKSDNSHHEKFNAQAGCDTDGHASS